MIKTFLHGVAVAAVALTLTGEARAQSFDNVQDKKGSTVIDARGNCVRTKWMESSDPCAPPAPPAPAPVAQPAPAPAPAPQPVVRLAKEDLTIYFGFDKAQITAESAAKLDRIADVLKGDKTITGASIVGFTDIVGTSDYNIKLSERRANAVNDYIVQRGYLNTQVAEVQALGKSRARMECGDLKSLNDKIACGAEDRKVEVQIQYRYLADQ